METEELNTANRLKEATPYGKVDGLPDGIAPAKAMRDEIIEQQDDPKKNDFEQTYIFCLLWAVGGFLENPERWLDIIFFFVGHSTLLYPTVKRYQLLCTGSFPYHI